MLIDYNEQSVFTKSIDIVDEGNFTVRATDDEGNEYYMIVKTVMGMTTMIKFGPTMPDAKLMMADFNLSCKKIKFSDKKIAAELNGMLNSPKACIIEAEEITEYEAYESVPDLQETLEEM